MAERTSVVHDLGTQGEWHAHRDRHTPGPAARPSGAVAFGPGQVAPPVLAVRMPLVDPLVEVLVADPHRRVSRILQFQPALDQLGRPATRQRVRHPRVQARVHHAPGLPRPARTCLGLALRGQRRIERASRPRPRLQPPGMVGPVRLVLVGREPQATPELPTDRGGGTMQLAGHLPDRLMIPETQHLNPDPLTPGHMRISFHSECSTSQRSEHQQSQP